MCNTNNYSFPYLERIYITKFYVDLPSDITVLPQTYTVHCIVTGGVDEEAIIKLYYDDSPADTELTQSTCTNNNDGYNCAVNNTSIKPNNTYPSTKDYEIIIEWDAKEISNGIFRQSQHDGDHRFLCTAAFGAITANHKGRNKSVTIKGTLL